LRNAECGRLIKLLQSSISAIRNFRNPQFPQSAIRNVI